MTEIYLHIVARMADYMATHPYASRKRLTLLEGLVMGVDVLDHLQILAPGQQVVPDWDVDLPYYVQRPLH